jgi:hypothetical protein
MIYSLGTYITPFFDSLVLLVHNHTCGYVNDNSRCTVITVEKLVESFDNITLLFQPSRFKHSQQVIDAHHYGIPRILLDSCLCIIL